MVKYTKQSLLELCKEKNLTIKDFTSEDTRITRAFLKTFGFEPFEFDEVLEWLNGNDWVDDSTIRQLRNRLSDVFMIDGNYYCGRAHIDYNVQCEFDTEPRDWGYWSNDTQEIVDIDQLMVAHFDLDEEITFDGYDALDTIEGLEIDWADDIDFTIEPSEIQIKFINGQGQNKELIVTPEAGLTVLEQINQWTQQLHDLQINTWKEFEIVK